MTATNKNWLEELKPGDDVIEHDRGGDSVSTVSRTTKTQIIIQHNRLNGSSVEIKYSKKNGFIVGGNSWSVASIKEADQKTIDKLKAEKK